MYSTSITRRVLAQSSEPEAHDKVLVRRIIRLDELGQNFFSSSDNPSVYKNMQLTDYPSRRTLCLVCLGRRTKVDNPSVCINAGTDELRCQNQHLVT